MQAMYTIAGAILGLIAGSADGSSFLGLVCGALIGTLFAHIRQLREKIAELGAVVRRGKSGPRSRPEAEQPPEPDGFSPLQEEQERVETPLPQSAGEPSESPWNLTQTKRTNFEPSLLQQAVSVVKTWITSGNVPVKVGVIVSFIGVSFLLKYAIDRELLALPLEFRLLGVALAGVVLMVTGWRLRERMRVYALSLQGGGAGILFLTIFAAFRVWQLLPPAPAFALLVAVTVCMGFLAIVQNAQSLALLGIVGGFLAPVLTSTGQGSHVTLFSYYLVLNIAILAIAWFRAWRGLNLVGFVFTFFIAGAWGYRYFRPQYFGSTEPFLVLYFLLYQAIAVLYALRQPPERLGLVDGTLVFGTPVIAFALQYELVHDFEYGLAISAAVLALFYVAMALFLKQKKGDYLKLLSESFIALAVAFGTIAIPLALDARWTSAAWAMEGAALVWIGMRQQRHLANLAGFALVLLSGLAFASFGWQDDIGIPIVNGNVMGGVLISLASLFVSRQLKPFTTDRLAVLYPSAASLAFAWGVLWWAGTGFVEITDRLLPRQLDTVFILFMSISTVAAAWIGRNRSWPQMESVTVLFLPVLAAMLFLHQFTYAHFLLSLGWIAWPVAFLTQGFVLHDMDRRQSRVAMAWHMATLALLTLVLAREISWWAGRPLEGAWPEAIAVSVPGAMALLIWAMRRRPAWPVPPHFTAYISASLTLVGIQALALTVLSVQQAGDPGLIPYLPLLNPFGLAMLFTFMTSALALRVVKLETSNQQLDIPVHTMQLFRAVLASTLFVITTAALVRGVHHFSQVPWTFDALFQSVIVQTSLSIYWGLLGFTGMVAGARTQRRNVWLAGAGFMALVVIKLFVIDLGNTGTLERIISFIGTGALLLIVGYFAPAPPRTDST